LSWVSQVKTTKSQDQKFLNSSILDLINFLELELPLFLELELDLPLESSFFCGLKTQTRCEKSPLVKLCFLIYMYIHYSISCPYISFDISLWFNIFRSFFHIGPKSEAGGKFFFRFLKF
jgi:hypothetical protein